MSKGKQIKQRKVNKMKFKFNGCTVEIKVIPEGAKKEDSFKTERLADDLSLALLHASNFCRCNGIHVSADHYYKLAQGFMQDI